MTTPVTALDDSYARAAKVIADVNPEQLALPTARAFGAERFYGDTLGIPVAGRVTDPVRMTFFTLGHRHDFAVMELGKHGPSPDRHTAGLAHVAFEVGDSLAQFDAVQRELEAAGVVILFELDRPSTKGMHMHDPDGNEVEPFVDGPRAAGDQPMTASARERTSFNREGPALSRRALSASSPICNFTWWRGQDLNLRPSGYELAQCPSAPIYSRAIRLTRRFARPR
jgi:catechol 2,3-dioxygenase